MFTKIEANVPLYLPGQKHPINAILEVSDEGYIELKALHSERAEELLKLLGEMGPAWQMSFMLEPIPARQK